MKSYISKGHLVLGYLGCSPNVVEPGKGRVDDKLLLDAGVKHVECYVIDVLVLGWGDWARIGMRVEE